MRLNRREFQATLAALGALPRAQAAAKTRMRIHLSAGSIGVKASQLEAIEYAAKFGYEAVEADAAFLAGLETGALKELTAAMRAKNIGWGTTGVSVEFRKGDEEFRATLSELPARARALERAGVTRMGTWISPASDHLTYLENLRLHGARLREVARIIGSHGMRLGLEYVGPKTSWTARRFPFVHTMKEMRELIGEIGQPNVGMVLDTWHWYCAGETEADLKTLRAEEVVSVDLNDAPAGIPVDQQFDLRRELPVSTGVIATGAFLNALHRLGTDAPVRCEPFNAALRSLKPELALQATIDAMRKAFSLIEA